EATEDSGGASYYIRQGDVNDTSTMPLSNVRSFEMNSAYFHQSDSQRVFCFSLSVKMSIGDGGDGDTLTNITEDTCLFECTDSESHERLPLFTMGLLGSGLRAGLTHTIPFNHHTAFVGKDTRVKDVKATMRKRFLPMRCLVLHCLRMMIMEQQWDAIQDIGAAIRNEVSEYIACYLAHIRAPGVSPLRVLTAWLGWRGSDQSLDEWTYKEIAEPLLTPDILSTHKTDLGGFLRVMVRLGDRKILLTQLSQAIRGDDEQSVVLDALLSSIVDEGGGEREGREGSGRPAKRRRFDL
ncbi:unnamed protein product, partial [Vitrella brassicaformis CCMP3155]